MNHSAQQNSVFLSYSHDSDEHRASVLSLAQRLRRDGINAVLDQYVNGTPKEGWPRWMLNCLDSAAHVLVICTESYYRRFRGHEDPRVGRGVNWEGAIITQQIYDARSATSKFVPIAMSSHYEEYIPDPLRAHTHYRVDLEMRYGALLSFLSGTAGIEPGPLGVPQSSTSKTGCTIPHVGSSSSSLPTTYVNGSEKRKAASHNNAPNGANHPVWDVYDLLRTARLNVKYYSCLTDRARKRNALLETLTAIAAPSSTVAGLWFWQTDLGVWAWALLSMVAACLAVAKPILRQSDRIRDLETQATAYRLLDFSVEGIAIGIRQEQRYTAELRRQFEATRDRLGEMIKNSKEFATDEALRKRCTDDIRRELPPSNFFVPKD